MTYIVALIGGIGSGKTTISNLFKDIGIHIIDADIITRNILKNNKIVINAIIKNCGVRFLKIDGSINRKLLRNYIFSCKTKKIWLEKLLHPIIINTMQKEIKRVTSPWCLWVVPLLIEMKLYKYTNRILLVDVPIQQQLERTIKRDNVNKIQANLIISSQSTRQERLLIADDIIHNINTIQSLKTYVKKLNKYYSKLANNIIF